MMKRTSRPSYGGAAAPSASLAAAAAAAAPAAGRQPHARAAMPRAVRARAAASAARHRRPAAPSSVAAAAAAANGPREIEWGAASPPAGSKHASDHGLILHDTLFADAHGAVHYRGGDDPRGDRRAVLGALREMERRESGGLAGGSSDDGTHSHVSAGSHPAVGGSSGAAGRAARVAASGRGARQAARLSPSSAAARQRQEPRKFVRGAKAVKHTHMVDQPRARGMA